MIFAVSQQKGSQPVHVGKPLVPLELHQDTNELDHKQLFQLSSSIMSLASQKATSSAECSSSQTTMPMVKQNLSRFLMVNMFSTKQPMVEPSVQHVPC